MKKRFVIVNLMLIFVVLFSMLLQSLHSYEHLIKLLSEKECHHHYSQKTEINHQHHPFDHCFVCEFTFGSYISTAFFSLRNRITLTISQQYSFLYKPTSQFFKGSLFALRAPPGFKLF
ncbi:hypothetical protein F6464_08000 [Flavobacterium luteum]|uniref:DUF2946 domain-containing protein n=1 Tax=Flavobacterium luteum TaxID=2026654 RepID=A0A7J5AEY2_9FLAO|nr:hypothetical protein F6464_08000 [Flavobacterium luteum]